MSDVDAAREAHPYVACPHGGCSLAANHHNLARREAAIRAESEHQVETLGGALVLAVEDEKRAEAKVAALREAAQGLVNALGARVPGLTRQQWVAVDALRAALAATPAEPHQYTPGGLRYPTHAELNGGPDEGEWVRAATPAEEERT